MAFRIRRGTDTDRLSVTPLEGELLYTTDTGKIYVGDGSTIGGNSVSASLVNDLSPQLSANLDLGGNNIVGTGNISINGNITATGTISLGDNVDDDIIVLGKIQGSLIPEQDKVFDLGSSVTKWNQVYVNELNADSAITTNNLTVTNIFPADSSIISVATNVEIDGSILPEQDKVFDLGSSVTKWNQVYVNELNADSAITTNNLTVTNIFPADSSTVSFSSNIEVSGSILPEQDKVFDLGSSVTKWNQVYVNELNADLRVTTNELDVTNIYAADSSTVSFSSTIEVSGSILPELSGLHSIGTNSNAWADAHVSNVFGENIFAENRIESSNVIISPIFLGNLEGSVLGIDSTTLVDYGTSAITTGKFRAPTNSYNISSDNSGEIEFLITSQEDRSVLKLKRESTTALTPVNDTIYGSILFERTDINGSLTSAVIAGTDRSIILFPDRTGTFTDTSKIVKFTDDGFFGVGTDNPAAVLDVRGEVTSTSYIQFGSFTTTERDNLTVSNGSVIYNTTVDKFQGYQAGSWINLDDGTVA